MKKLLLIILAVVLCSAIAQAKSLTAILTADGMGNVNIEVIENTFYGSMDFHEIGTGTYRLESALGELTTGRTTEFSSLMPTFYAYSEYIDTYRINVYELDGFGGSPTFGNPVCVHIESD